MWVISSCAVMFHLWNTQAVNAVGAGLFSDVATVQTPASVPAAVEHVEEMRPDSVGASTAHSTPTSLALRWTEPNCHGAEITGYNIDFGEEQPLSIGRTNFHVLENLHSDTTYRYDLYKNMTYKLIIIFSSISYKCFCCVPGYECKQWIAWVLVPLAQFLSSGHGLCLLNPRCWSVWWLALRVWSWNGETGFRTVMAHTTACTCKLRWTGTGIVTSM